MSVKRGKYYWVRTEGGKEIAFKRDSGAWEMHGIDCTEDLRELILEVYEEVANGLNKKPEKALAIQGVSNAKRTVCEKHVCVESKVNFGYRVCVNCYALFPIAN